MVEITYVYIDTIFAFYGNVILLLFFFFFFFQPIFTA